MQPHPPVDYQTTAPPPGVHMPAAFPVHQEFTTMNGMEMIVGQHHQIMSQQYQPYAPQGNPASLSSTQPQYVSAPYVSTQPPQYVTTSSASQHHPPMASQQFQYTQPHQTANSQYPPGSSAPPFDASMNMVAMPMQLQPVVALSQAPYIQQQDVMSPPRSSSAASASVAQPVTTTAAAEPTANGGIGGLALEELKMKLRRQLEYYFSRENLAHDEYLKTQMDQDQFVPIWTIASFNQVKRLTNDIKLVTQVLRDSPNVLVDPEGLKVKPNHTRCTVILREIPDDTEKHEVENLFNHSSCPKIRNCEFALNGTWYITFETEGDALEAYQYLHEIAKNFKGKPICARIKKKPMDRVLNSGPPATPTGTVGSTTPTAPGAPSPVAVTPTQNPQSKNGYVPGAPPQIATGAQPVTAAVPGGATSVANIMSTIPATSQAYQFVPGQQPSSLPTMQQAPNSSQIYYAQLPQYFQATAPAHNGLMQPAAPWAYPNGFSQGFGAPNMIPDNSTIFSAPHYKGPGGRGGYHHKSQRGRRVDRSGNMTSDRANASSDQRDMRFQQQTQSNNFNQMSYQPQQQQQQGANSHYGNNNSAYNSYRGGAGGGGAGGGRGSWDSNKKSYHNNTSYQTTIHSAGPPVASIATSSSPPVSFNNASKSSTNPPLVSAAPVTVPTTSNISKEDIKSSSTVTTSKSATPVVSVASSGLPAASTLQPQQPDAEAPTTHSRHHSSSSTTGTSVPSAAKAQQNRVPNNEDLGHAYYQHHSKSSVESKDGQGRRGRGRGGSRGGGRMMSDDARDMGPAGGRGGYSGRGGYQGYRGGHSGGRDVGGGHGGAETGAPGTGTGPGSKMVAPPPPEFEMKGNDFPALPGAGEATATRKISESAESGPWDSNRFLDVVKGTAKMKIKKDDDQDEDQTESEPKEELYEPRDASSSAQLSNSSQGCHDQEPSSAASPTASSTASAAATASSGGTSAKVLPDKSHPSSNTVIPSASSNKSSSTQPQHNRSSSQNQPEVTVNGEVSGKAGAPVVSVSVSQTSESKQSPSDGKSQRTYAQIAQKEAADKAAAAAAAAATTPPASTAVTPSGPESADSKAVSAAPKKIVKEQAVKNIQGVSNGKDTTDQKPSVISSSSTTTASSTATSNAATSTSGSGGSGKTPAASPNASTASEGKKKPATSGGGGSGVSGKDANKRPSKAVQGKPAGAVQSPTTSGVK